MIILKVIHGYPPTYNAGSEVYSQTICEALAERHSVHVFTREADPYRPDFQLRKITQNCVPVTLINLPRERDGYAHEPVDRAFTELLREFQPQVVHFGHLNHLSTGLVRAAKEYGARIIFTLHDFWLMCPRGQFLQRNFDGEHVHRLCDGQKDQKCATNCYRMYDSGCAADRATDLAYRTEWIARRMQTVRELLPLIDRFVAPSEYLRRRFIDDFGLEAERITYLDYGFDTARFEYTYQPEPERPYTFGYIGTHIPAKGVNQLIEAFAQLSVPARLLIFGREHGQDTEALKRLAEQSSNPIEFCGEYRNEEMVDRVFRRVDAIVVPSIWGENSPLVIHEAQACRVPVITADFGGMREYVAHQKNGLLFEHRSVASLRDRLNYAVSHPTNMQQLGKRGYLKTADGSVPTVAEHTAALERLYAPSDFWRITIDTNPEDCNLKCIMCEEHSPYSDFIPNLYRTTGVKRRRMPNQWLHDIFRQAQQLGVREIIPSTMGEPLLYKGFEEIFELSRETGIKINLTTNGTFPKKSVVEWAMLIAPNTTDIKISWNGATAETAALIMQRIDFEQCLENVRQFIKVRDQVFIETGEFCRVTFQLTFMENNMHELADIVRLAASLGVDRVKGHQLWAHFDQIKTLDFRRSPEAITRWNSYVREARHAAKHHLKPNSEQVLLENIEPLVETGTHEVPESYECPFLGRELWISATGKYSPCCAPDELRQSLGDFGNFTESTVGEVLTSNHYQDLLTNYTSNSLCKTCTMRRPARRK